MFEDTLSRRLDRGREQALLEDPTKVLFVLCALCLVCDKMGIVCMYVWEREREKEKERERRKREREEEERERGMEEGKGKA